MKRVLIVDDHPLSREGLRGRLADATEDFEIVGEAEDALEAIEQFETGSPDLVVLDLDLGSVMTGFELIQVLRKRPAVPLIAVWSATKEPSVIAEALRLGADGYLLKTFPGDEVVRALRAVSAGWGFWPVSLETLKEASARLRASAPPAIVDESSLTPREKEVLLGMRRGLTNKRIASTMEINERTVESYRASLIAKLERTQTGRALLEFLRNSE